MDTTGGGDGGGGGGGVLAGVKAAFEAVSNMLEPASCRALLEAIVSKYVALTQEELEEVRSCNLIWLMQCQAL